MKILKNGTVKVAEDDLVWTHIPEDFESKDISGEYYVGDKSCLVRSKIPYVILKKELVAIDSLEKEPIHPQNFKDIIPEKDGFVPVIPSKNIIINDTHSKTEYVLCIPENGYSCEGDNRYIPTIRRDAMNLYNTFTSKIYTTKSGVTIIIDNEKLIYIGMNYFDRENNIIQDTQSVIEFLKEKN